MRLALVAVVLLVVAAGLLLLAPSDGDDSFEDRAAATCTEFADRVRAEQALSFPNGAPSDDARNEYLSHAFVDTMDALVAELRGLRPPGEVTGALDDLSARIDALRADPAAFFPVFADPFEADIAPVFDRAGLPSCGSEFFAAPA